LFFLTEALMTSLDLTLHLNLGVGQ
jgi:hypothetical protein